jgi:hypothetical protein
MSEETKEPKQLQTLSHYFEDYIKQYQMDWEYRHRAVIAALEVDEVASKIAKAYEKVLRSSGLERRESITSRSN